jgi:hypothetical protein
LNDGESEFGKKRSEKEIFMTEVIRSGGTIKFSGRQPSAVKRSGERAPPPCGDATWLMEPTRGIVYLLIGAAEAT